MLQEDKFKQTMKPNIRKIEFFDRENEKQEILNILRTEPQLLNFIYGPINSGKTTLITDMIENLPDDYVVFYVNLRRKSIIRYEDFIRVLFAIEEGGFLKKIKNIFTKVLKHITSTGEKTLYKSHGIPVDKSLLETFFKEKSNEDVFNYLVEYFKNIAKHKTPVLVIDELQMIGGLEINGKLIYKLFNFFIGLTKELHICHVFALSSDSLFIERVYNEAILKDRCRYLLINNFDEETTLKFLGKYNINKEEQKLIYKNIGGKPAHLIRIIDAKKRGKEIMNEVKEMLESRKKETNDTLRKLKEFGSEIKYNNVSYNVDYTKVISTLKMFGEKDEISANDISEVIKMYLVKDNILFAECANETIKPQSKLDLLAIREILKEMK